MSGNAERKPPTELSPESSGLVPARSSRPKRDDRRVRRTRDVLGDALVELIREKSFDEITVQEVLDRAGVGRTTFYTHFRDKQDLFLSDVEDFLEGMATLLTRRGADPRRIAPVQELFAHLADVREFYTGLVASGKAGDVRELGVGYFARSMEQRFLMAEVRVPASELRATAHALAGTLFALLDWWIAHADAATPAEMDALFHRLVWRGVGSVDDGKG